MPQSFFRNGRWVPHAQMVEMMELERMPKPKAEKGSPESAVTLSALEEMSVEDLLVMYQEYSKKHPGARYGANKDWLITKIMEYVK